MSHPAPATALRVAVIGAGPAGIYASDLLVKNAASIGREIHIDLIEKLPAPFGLIRYGVAPDHPRIKGIITSLHRVLDRPEIRLLGNIEIGKDVTVEELQEHYDAVVFATGAVQDRDLDIPGVDAEGSYGAADFVGFYDGNPDFPRTWDLSAQSVAVIGVGNVGLDVARVLAKTAEELNVTEIPENVYETLRTNQATEVHVFGRRGPAQAKFTPQELKELDHSPTVNVVVAPEDIDYDEASIEARSSSKSQDLVCQILEGYAIREPKDAPHTLQIHLFESPVEILTHDGRVVGLRTSAPSSTVPATSAAPARSPTGRSRPSTAPSATAPNRSPACPSITSSTSSPTTAATSSTMPAPRSRPVRHRLDQRGPIGLIGNTSPTPRDHRPLLADAAAGRLTAPTREADAILELRRPRHPRHHLGGLVAA